MLRQGWFCLALHSPSKSLHTTTSATRLAWTAYKYQSRSAQCLGRYPSLVLHHTPVYPSVHLSVSLPKLHAQLYCTKPPEEDKAKSADSLDDKSLSVFQRFKLVYKEYGKTLIGVHVVTSIAWYGAFYILARRLVIHPALMLRV